MYLFQLENSQPTGNWLLIGLGGGVLTMKLIRAFPKVSFVIFYLLLFLIYGNVEGSFNRY
jgi:hypothetical protein